MVFFHKDDYSINNSTHCFLCIYFQYFQVIFRCQVFFNITFGPSLLCKTICKVNCAKYQGSTWTPLDLLVRGMDQRQNFLLKIRQYFPVFFNHPLQYKIFFKYIHFKRVINKYIFINQRIVQLYPI